MRKVAHQQHFMRFFLALVVLLLSSSNSSFCQAFQSALPSRHQQRKFSSSTLLPFISPSLTTDGVGRRTAATLEQPEKKLVSSSEQPAFMSSSTSLSMFMGSEGGILGVGTPELATILLVGYFVLGPSDLYKIVKEVGKFIQNARTLSTDLTTSFESNMESQLQLEELRKAQRELNDAFSFRRTINVDENADAFATTSATYEQEAPAAAAAGAAAAVASSANETAAAENAPPKKIRRRVKKKKQPEEQVAAEQVPSTVPDLEMPSAATPATTTAASDSSSMTTAEEALIDEEFEKYVSMGKSESDWYSDDVTTAAAAAETNKTATLAQQSPEEAAAAQSRFQQQLSGNWNDKILENDDSLQPLAAVMNKIALLEKEKMAATKRLEEEFAKRTELENEYYAQQRELLEDAAQQVQAAAFGVDVEPAASSSKTKQKTK